MNNLGIVVIARNEGKRLVRCLNSLKTRAPINTKIVYVDSGSTDGSLEFAKSVGVEVISLDLSTPFTMARGRNTGFKYLTVHYPELKYIQFLDGDCELSANWLEQSLAYIEKSPDVAIVCGRRRERFPEASIYNRLVDMEWNTPVGETLACGGDALARVTALEQVNGYNPSMICGEEPEMCLRLRQMGWKIHRIEPDMTLHDADISSFSQWWKRSTRYGWSVAEGKVLHGHRPEYYMVRENYSGWIWGLLVPSTILSLLWLTSGFSAILFWVYPIMMFRVYRFRVNAGDSKSHAYLYAFFCVLSKIPQVMGQTKYWITKWQGKKSTIIEYKTPGSPKQQREKISV